MTISQAVKLPNGTRVYWDALPGDTGVINSGSERVDWKDGQVTLFIDDWALSHVHVLQAKVSS